MSATITFDSNFYKWIEQVKTISTSRGQMEKEFIDIAAFAVIDVLRTNTPVENGELRDSWKVFEKTSKFIIVGTELTDKFLQVVNGVKPQVIMAKNGKAMHFFIGGEEFFRVSIKHPGFVKLDFITPIVNVLNQMMEALVVSLVQKHWKIFQDIRVQNITKVNLSKTVGLTGVKINARRGRGSGIQKAKTGRKTFKRTLSRRRRTGKFITSQKTTIG